MTVHVLMGLPRAYCTSLSTSLGEKEAKFLHPWEFTWSFESILLEEWT